VLKIENWHQRYHSRHTLCTLSYANIFPHHAIQLICTDERHLPTSSQNHIRPTPVRRNRCKYGRRSRGRLDEVEALRAEGGRRGGCLGYLGLTAVETFWESEAVESGTRLGREAACADDERKGGLVQEFVRGGKERTGRRFSRKVCPSQSQAGRARSYL
jgi:hypothetical protein